jgi:hypothetical protein
MIVDFKNSIVVFDTEADNLLLKVKNMWCIYIIDVETRKGYLFHDYPEFDNEVVTDEGKEYTIPVRTGTLKEGAISLYKAKKMIAHNILGYDLFLLNMFFPQFKVDKALPKCWDTLIQSKVQQYDRRPVKGYKGIHGLEVWGGRLGHKKPKVTDWSFIDAFKLHRCIVDVGINLEVYLKLEKDKELAWIHKKVDFTEGLVHDHTYRFNATYQELRGSAFDSEAARDCVVELDKFIEDLNDELEPLLPPTIKIVSQKCTWEVVGKALGWTKWPQTKKEFRGRLGVVKEYDLKPAAKPTTKLTVATGNYAAKLAEYFDIDPKSAKTTRVVDGAFSKVAFIPSKMTQVEVVKDYLLKFCEWVPTEYNYKKGPTGTFERDDNYNLIKTSPKLTEDSYASIKGGIGKSIAEYNSYNHRRRFLENSKDDEKGLLNLVREDGRIPCGINVFGTATGRSSQYGWVNAPGPGALYGKQIRKLIVAPEGRILVGADMKSAQLSIAGYYARNKEYLDAVLDGQEFKLDDSGNEVMHPTTGKPWYVGESGHCVNARAFGLVTDEQWKRAVETQDQEVIEWIGTQRKLSKGGSFATIFGASGKKVATTLGIPEKKGDAAREKFLGDIGLDEPIEILAQMTKEKVHGAGAFIELPFGYWAWCKSPHKYFNYLDQGTEAACQKVAVNYFEQEYRARGLDCYKILDVHDEFMVESDLGCKHEVGALMCESYKFASDECFEWHKKHSRYFKNLEFPFNLDGGYKLGKNYYEVH